METKTYLLRTMSDTVETDIKRVHVIANEVLNRYQKPALSWEGLRKIADGPFDLFLIPLIFPQEFEKNCNVIFNEARRQEIRGHALEIARNHGFDTHPPELIPGVEDSLRAAEEAGLINVLLTTGGRRFQHQAMERHGIGRYFHDIIDREQTYFTKEQGIYHFFRKQNLPELRVTLLSGTASYIRAGNNLRSCKVGGSELSVRTVALATAHSYSDEATLTAARPNLLIHSLEELLPRLRGEGDSK
jgi:phosphoglycolate phosphatase-like HAD superfamily hydrolase